MIPALIFIVFVLFGRLLPEKWYPHAIYFVTLSLIYAVTLPGLNVVGSDITGELQTTNYIIQHGWDLSLRNSASTSFVVGWLVPLIKIPPVWVYKCILPLFLAGVPTVLYFVFKKIFTTKQALYSVMFFISVPVLQMEIASIGKSMVAEFLMALAILFMVVDIKWWIKYPAILILGLLSAWAHYTIGIMLTGFILGVGIFLLIKEWRKAVAYLLIGVIVAGGICGYFSSVGEGFIFTAIRNIGIAYSTYTQQQITPPAVTTPKVTAPIVKPTPVRVPVVQALKTPVKPNYLSSQSPLIKIALGLDFFEVGWLGKLFRILQYITQGFVLLGCWLILWSKVKREFKGGVLAALILIGCCVFVPFFANIINATRFYHLALFFVAPALIMGFEWVYRRIQCISGYQS
jgi:uncharacterized membrane protein